MKTTLKNLAIAGTLTILALNAQAADNARSPDDIIAAHCVACHSVGLLNAPKIGDTPAWQERAKKAGGLDGLLASTIKGLSIMPPKGTCGDCTDEELKSTIQSMSGLK
ncbi:MULTISPECIES: c-type cytochrome [Pseudomonas syringae group]|uniref:Cytochrome c5 family protein n=1 Tax=Pseudomonas coronafaciens pv. coronafaciens TaxID=235275 RepID=A0AAE6UJK2_9PSED|nr:MULTISPECIES: c-type cytochrome [Pseudomonas syringae group]MCF5712700.1 cytochrome c5 family protein [Pseudomonas tremae]MCF5745494.1 cytochrome c5 family protein [Pseudomonas tremae]QGT79679.1 cytochrome c5 family protein [Pseudomonas coronafaciens pv. coronafaciens]QIQ72446.1 Cytochrome c5 [Pseudomonas coronafaciens]RMM76894.1 Cytochrome c5 [Pseudomonas coronafaciens pv. striafaciens]